MTNLTLDQAWDYTKRMWKWIAFQKVVIKDPRPIFDLKVVWLTDNYPQFLKMRNSCFFCAIASNGCTKCPGKLVDANFNCHNLAYAYDIKPDAFYREIIHLDKIRTAKPPEHVWRHGDVFKNTAGLWVYLKNVNTGSYIVNLDNRGDGSLVVQLSYARFLFNIKDKL